MSFTRQWTSDQQIRQQTTADARQHMHCWTLLEARKTLGAGLLI